MTTSTITYSLRQDAASFAMPASMKHGTVQAGVDGDVTLARRHAR
jgi:hypothetical protein